MSLIGYIMGAFPPGVARPRRVRDGERAPAATRTARAYDVIKAGPGDFPVGLTRVDGRLVGARGRRETRIDAYRAHARGLATSRRARGDDFVGVQAYSRTRLGATGCRSGPSPASRSLSMGYEYWPQALEASIRHAVEVTGTPVYVTENGIGTDDDDQRVRYVHRGARTASAAASPTASTCAATSTGRCSTTSSGRSGTRPRFGLVAVDRETHARTLKPSAAWLGDIARANRLGG